MTHDPQINEREIKRRTFGRTIFAALAGLLAVPKQDETAEILADPDFANALRESNKQADAGKTRRWGEIKDTYTTPTVHGWSEEERDRALDASTMTFSDNTAYIGECIYSHTDKKGCRHFTMQWNEV